MGGPRLALDLDLVCYETTAPAAGFPECGTRLRMPQPGGSAACVARGLEHISRVEGSAMTDRKPAERVDTTVPLRCRCGEVRGIARQVSPKGGFRVVCYCEDCQTFARFLQREDVLDAAGGTDIFQMPPARVELVAGLDAVRCLRLSERGVLRWYTDCCRTPIANSAGPGFPIIGMIHS